MTTAPLSEREVLPYLVASAILITVILGAIRHVPIASCWDDLSSLFSIVLAVIGTLYIYQQNGGKNGQHLLQRYIVISWVVSIRWFVGFIITYSILLGILLGMHVSIENTALIVFIFNLIIQAILYWRIGYHVHDLAQKTMFQENI